MKKLVEVENSKMEILYVENFMKSEVRDDKQKARAGACTRRLFLDYTRYRTAGIIQDKPSVNK